MYPGKDYENDEVYQFKMAQYKNMSHMRNEEIHAINDQNLQKAIHKH